MTTTNAEARQSEAMASPRAGQQRLVLHLCVVWVVASLLGAVALGPRGGVSVGAGVLLCAANMWLMKRLLVAMGRGAGASAAWALVLPFKLVGLIGLAYALVAYAGLGPVPLAIGFATLPLTGVFLPRAATLPAPPAPARGREAARLTPPSPGPGGPPAQVTFRA